MVERTAVNRDVVGSSPTRGVTVREEETVREMAERELTRQGGGRNRKPHPKKEIRLRGQAVKTSPFHGGNTGSIPVGVSYMKTSFLVSCNMCRCGSIGRAADL